MVRVFFRKVNSPQQSIITESMYDNISLIEHKLGETYCYGIDNFDNKPPKFVVVIAPDDNIIYKGRVIIPDDEDELLSLDPQLTENQKTNIVSNNYVIIKEPPDEFGAETDDEQDGGKRRKGKNSKKNKKSKKSKKSKKHLIKNKISRKNKNKNKFTRKHSK
jgi:hypothetical protein